MTRGYATYVSLNRGALWKANRPLPSRFDIELTERCNLNCIHCYINQPASDVEIQGREMSTDRIKLILKEAAELGALGVRFTGGEPLLRKDFAEVYLFARRLGLRVLLFTNGTLLTREIADLLAWVPPLEKIEITVYGMSEETYHAITGARGAFKAVRYGIELLQERRVPFVVKGAYLRPNQHEMQAFGDWVASLYSSPVRPSFVTFLTMRGRRDSEVKNKEIQALRIPTGEGLRVLMRDADRYSKHMEHFYSKFMGPPGDKLFNCGAGRGFCVDAFGRVQPCMLMRDPSLVYDLQPQVHPEATWSEERPSLRDALENFFPQVREMRATRADYLERCARCFLHGLCEQCPAKSWMENGTLDTPVEYECEIAHAQARELGLLARGERAWEVSNWRERLQRKGAPVADPGGTWAEKGVM